MKPPCLEAFVLRTLAIIVFLFGMTVQADGLRLRADDLPRGVVNTQDPNDVSLSPQESLARITVPDGFHVTLFAGEPAVRRPIAFDFDDRGRLWVVENYSHPVWKSDGTMDRILILEDTNHDGTFDRRTVFWDKGRYLTGIAVGHGGVWIANTPELSFIPDRDYDDKPDSEPVVMLDGFQRSKNNVLNNFHWGPDGWLYGAIGVANRSLVGRPGAANDERTPITRGIWRYHPLRHDFEVVAEGMVNPWGADFNEFGDLFTTNTVIAHLWHIVPGMYCQRRDNERDNPYVYRRIQSITNHLHWGGGQWQSSRESHGRHSVAGGGHAHCGAMVYLGDNWPQRYRGKLFTANLHGNRINCDQLVPSRSTYVGVHDEDFLFGNDPWFRGMSVKYGPDGGVYVSDWHDIGECHDSDGSHRSSGRIYKVVFGKPEKRAVDLQGLNDHQLVAMQLHSNAWFARHARRILQERAAAGSDLSTAHLRLQEIFAKDDDEINKLRAFWTLFVTGGLDEFALINLLEHDSEHVRRWAIRFLVDDRPPGSKAAAALKIVASADESAKVRLAVAAAIPRLKREHRWPIAQALMMHAADATDPYLPLMIWYGIEPVVSEDRSAALKLASASCIPMLRRFIARRLLDEDASHAEQVLTSVLKCDDETVRFDLLQGMLEALEVSGSHDPPDSWNELYAQQASVVDPELRSTVVRLATLFGDKKAIARLRRVVLDKQAPANQRRDSLLALLNVEDGVKVSMLHRLVSEASILRREALRSLILRNESSTAGVVLDLYADLDSAERQDAISVLGTRRSFALELLDAIGSGVVDRDDVSAFALQQLRAFRDQTIQGRVNALWADDAEQLSKSDEIARYKAQMTPDFLARGNVHAGRRLFERTCSKCHTLFGEGGSIAPDLTGSGRKQLDYVLSNLIDPSAVIDPAYRLTTMITVDGRVLSGFIVHQGDKFVVLRTQEAQVRLAMGDIDELHTSEKSMMPEGMLRSFSDEEFRDLILYLASPQQVPLDETDDYHSLFERLLLFLSDLSLSILRHRPIQLRWGFSCSDMPAGQPNLDDTSKHTLKSRKEHWQAGGIH
jgi:putative membrane-bound dehydrogenase-like protein